jgi:hypothetical protein
MNCKICNSPTRVITNQLILNKYKVNYHQCIHCRFIQTDDPFWLTESYQHAITALDIGLVSRNLYLQREIPNIIDSFFPEAKIMLDYGGGYGMFVRLMRDLGYNFFRQDIYCENLFADYFDFKDCPVKKTALLTAFEVFEHLQNPLSEIAKMFQLSDNILFSTNLIPADTNNFHSWWYVSPLTGQHIAFYDLHTLKFIADKCGKNLYSNKHNLHLLTSKSFTDTFVKKVFNNNEKTSLLKKVFKVLFNQSNTVREKQSLQQSDYQYIQNKLKERT